jgi:hypothetical protein
MITSKLVYTDINTFINIFIYMYTVSHNVMLISTFVLMLKTYCMFLLSLTLKNVNDNGIFNNNKALRYINKVSVINNKILSMY